MKKKRPSKFSLIANAIHGSVSRSFKRIEFDNKRFVCSALRPGHVCVYVHVWSVPGEKKQMLELWRYCPAPNITKPNKFKNMSDLRRADTQTLTR